LYLILIQEVAVCSHSPYEPVLIRLSGLGQLSKHLAAAKSFSIA
jgi:hypothetical protein